MIRLVLVDDHELIRSGLRRAFDSEPDCDVVAEAATCAAASEVLTSADPDVVVVDVSLPDGNGLDLVRKLRAASARLGIVVLTMFSSDEHLFRALESGASAFVTKAESTSELVAAVRHAAVSPNAFTASGLAAAMHRRVEGTGDVRLTPREAEILELLKLGLPAHAIAAKLYMSSSTAKAHISKLYERLGARNRTQAIMEAVRLRLISPAEHDVAS
jgi:DNA-binding NarL/FixJ family response regulator